MIDIARLIINEPLTEDFCWLVQAEPGKLPRLTLPGGETTDLMQLLYRVFFPSSSRTLGQGDQLNHLCSNGCLEPRRGKTYVKFCVNPHHFYQGDKVDGVPCAKPPAKGCPHNTPCRMSNRETGRVYFTLALPNPEIPLDDDPEEDPAQGFFSGDSQGSEKSSREGFEGSSGEESPEEFLRGPSLGSKGISVESREEEGEGFEGGPSREDLDENREDLEGHQDNLEDHQEELPGPSFRGYRRRQESRRLEFLRLRFAKRQERREAKDKLRRKVVDLERKLQRKRRMLNRM